MFIVSWIAFDRQTAAALNVPVTEGDALDSALASSSSIALLPAEPDVLLVLIHQNRFVAPRNEAPVAYVATGFLGLSDEPVYEEEPAAPEEKWWHKLIG